MYICHLYLAPPHLSYRQGRFVQAPAAMCSPSSHCQAQTQQAQDCHIHALLYLPAKTANQIHRRSQPPAAKAGAVSGQCVYGTRQSHVAGLFLSGLTRLTQSSPLTHRPLSSSSQQAASYVTGRARGAPCLKPIEGTRYAGPYHYQQQVPAVLMPPAHRPPPRLLH